MHSQKSLKNKKYSLVCKEILAKHCIELPDDGSLVVRNGAIFKYFWFMLYRNGTMHDQKSLKNKKNSLVCKEILAKLPDDRSLVVRNMLEKF
jgi:hypothetical protein